jgi:hypothetical protein
VFQRKGIRASAVSARRPWHLGYGLLPKNQINLSNLWQIPATFFLVCNLN